MAGMEESGVGLGRDEGLGEARWDETVWNSLLLKIKQAVCGRLAGWHASPQVMGAFHE